MTSLRGVTPENTQQGTLTATAGEARDSVVFMGHENNQKSGPLTNNRLEKCKVAETEDKHQSSLNYFHSQNTVVLF